MLIYPPGKFEAKGLPLLTLIHGGPADADGDHFEADWYQWSALAATNGWLVLHAQLSRFHWLRRQILMQIVPEIVSRPGKTFWRASMRCEGWSSRSGPPCHAGYSYGGYMTNWLITQTTRFKAAMTGAGAVEHAGNG